MSHVSAVSQAHRHREDPLAGVTLLKGAGVYIPTACDNFTLSGKHVPVRKPPPPPVYPLPTPVAFGCLGDLILTAFRFAPETV